MKRFLALFLTILLLPLSALAREQRRVFYEDETEPFPEDAALLTLRVCPLLGADCMLLTLGEHTMLVDAGMEYQYPQVRQMLEEAGVTRLEYLFNSHPHDDHAGSIVPLVRDGFPIGTFFTLFPHDYQGYYMIQISTLRALEAAGVPIVDLKSEDTIPFGDARITVYRIPVEWNPDEPECNDLSGVLMVRYGECSLLLTADLDVRAQSRIIKLYDLQADIMKYPHHGSRPTFRAFLKAVDPEYTFFTHSSFNTQEAQEDLRTNGYRRMTFATWGTITLQSDGQKWIVRQDIEADLMDYVEKYREYFNIR